MTRIVPRVGSSNAGTLRDVFFFFSNRLGCLGSLALSAGVTLVLLFLMGVFR
jgi:hypothetical protein